MYKEQAVAAAHGRMVVDQDLFPWPESDDALRRFGERFLARSVSREEWNHAAHLACAVYMIMLRDDLVAERDMPAAIRAHNEAAGTPNSDESGFHATITWASLAVVRSFCWRYPEGTSASALARALIRSRFGDRDWLNAHWSRRALWSAAARRGWTPPDMEPLPAPVLLPGVTIVDGNVPGAAPEVRALLREYEAALGIDLAFQGFADELAGLPGAYAPPAGALHLAYVDGALAGCCAMRPLEDGACEMKRLWVRPKFRKRGVAQLLISEAIDSARRAGHDRMMLDTLPRMEEARRLYRRIGFAPVEPYGVPALPGTIWLGRPIARAG